MNHAKFNTVYMSLGGNLGDPFFTLKKAFSELAKLDEVKECQISRFYGTSPVGNPNQPPFVNAVCRFNTFLDPKMLLRKLQAIEVALGKVPKPKQAPRPIDIDILFYGNQYYNDEELIIPHPAWMQRLFVLVPLADLTSCITLNFDQDVKYFIIQDLIDQLAGSQQIVSLLE